MLYSSPPADIQLAPEASGKGVTISNLIPGERDLKFGATIEMVGQRIRDE